MSNSSDETSDALLAKPHYQTESMVTHNLQLSGIPRTEQTFQRDYQLLTGCYGYFFLQHDNHYFCDFKL